MGTISPNKAGLALGALLGGGHVLWSLLVALGWAQPLIDFIFWIHFIEPVHVVGTFSTGIALMLVFLTAGIGYAIGGLFGVIWNRIHR